MRGESEPEADIPIHISSCVIEIQRGGTAIHSIIPIAATEGQPRVNYPLSAGLFETANYLANLH